MYLKLCSRDEILEGVSGISRLIVKFEIVREEEML